MSLRNRLAMPRVARLFLLSLIAILALPAAAQAANVTVSGGTITFNAAAGETNTAIVVKQQTTPVATVYFVGDQNPAVTVTASPAQGCLPTPPALGLPEGYLCTVTIATPITSVVENLGDGNDTGVINTLAGGAVGTFNGGAGTDTLVGGGERDIFNGGSAVDNAAYVGISAAGITRTSPVTAVLPAGASPTTGNGQAGENDSIAADVEDLTGGNGNDTLTGNGVANTIAGAAPPGTPDVNPQPPGTESRDTISGGGGDDSLLAGDSGAVNGGLGNDTIVGGRSLANTTFVNGAGDDDTIVSGLGKDDVTGGGGDDILAYVTVSQAGLSIVNRGGNGVTVQLPEPGTLGSGGRTGSTENDVIHHDIHTLIGSNGNDTLNGSNGPDTILGAAPVGTGNGVLDTPAGTDTINGRGGADTLVGGDRGAVNGGDADDNLVGGRSTAAGSKTVVHGNAGDDTLVSNLGNDEMFGDAGANTLAYVSVSQNGLSIVNRGTGAGALVQLPEPGATGTGGQTSTPENDLIHDDIRTLIGSNGNDFLIGSDQEDTIVGAAPVGTGNGVADTPAGNDTIYGRGAADTLVGGDRGSVSGGAGGDSIVGGRSTVASHLTILHGNEDNDTIVSGLGNDEIFGDAGANTLAYASVEQAGLDIVNRPNGVTATIPNAGLTATGGRTGGAERDIIHAEIGTLVGSNGNDFLVGNNLANTIVGVAPAGTPGVKPGPPGNDIYAGADGSDFLLGAEGSDFQFGGPGIDVLVSNAGPDYLAGQAGIDTLSSGDGNDANFTKDGTLDSITCGVGTDYLQADAIDSHPAGDCENIVLP
jgi:Ca2+-binding RTX toxin-like protein